MIKHLPQPTTIDETKSNEINSVVSVSQAGQYKTKLIVMYTPIKPSQITGGLETYFIYKI